MPETIRLNAHVGAPDLRTLKPFRDLGDFLLDAGDRKPGSATAAEDIKALFAREGVVVLADTGLEHMRDLVPWSRFVIDEIMSYDGGSFERETFHDNVYDVASEPPNLYIHPHNEMSYLPSFPRCLVFGCLAAPAQGGETVLADNRAVTHRLLESELGQKLKRHGVSYIRNFSSADHPPAIVYRHWQDTFGVATRDEMEALAQRQAWNLTWKNGGGLRVSYTFDAYEYHEGLGESLLFAAVGHHGMHFDHHSPFNTLPFGERPFHMTLGNGEPFEAREIEYLVRIFDRYSLPIRWQAGMIAMIDNERWTHARPPFSLKQGEQRTLGVVLGNRKRRIGARF